ncbi:MAG: alpha/beta hydrolase family protein [Flavobacteriia bacterium]
MSYEPGKVVPLAVLPGKKKLTIKAKVVTRPYETEGKCHRHLRRSCAQIRTTECDHQQTPSRMVKIPTMLFIPGYTCSSLYEQTNNHPYKRIIDAYVDVGYETLRIEKSGLGDSKNTPPCESCDLLNEIENFGVGLKRLKSLPYVDTNQIIIVGHLMGGLSHLPLVLNIKWLGL